MLSAIRSSPAKKKLAGDEDRSMGGPDGTGNAGKSYDINCFNLGDT